MSINRFLCVVIFGIAMYGWGKSVGERRILREAAKQCAAACPYCPDTLAAEKGE